MEVATTLGEVHVADKHQMVIPITGSTDDSGNDSGTAGLGALACEPQSA